jgi:hypothetical protein
VAKREDLFKDEAASLMDEMAEVLNEMREDGTCLTEDIRRIADEMDEVWKFVMETAETVEEEVIDEEE